jgi:hypothetical protein
MPDPALNGLHDTSVPVPSRTLKEVPADAEIVSHRLMLRAGMMRKLAAGIYTWLPLGLKVLKKVEGIVREEMDRAGALECLASMVLPAELWQESGRYAKYGPELLRLKARHQRDFVLGPTHEEVFTDLIRRDVRSYRQLPLNLYQIQMIPRRDQAALRRMRGREFLMDAYSFHLTDADLNASTNTRDDKRTTPASISASSRPTAVHRRRRGGSSGARPIRRGSARRIRHVRLRCEHRVMNQPRYRPAAKSTAKVSTRMQNCEDGRR